MDRPPALWMAILRAEHVDPEILRRYAEREAPTPWGILRLCIIGASSLVTVATRWGSFAELVTCHGPEDAPSLAAAGFTVSAGSAANLTFSEDGVAYTARGWADEASNTPPPHTEGLRLEYRFPGDAAPATVIEAQPSPEGLWLRTRHDYPEWGLAVWTESDWRLR